MIISEPRIDSLHNDKSPDPIVSQRIGVVAESMQTQFALCLPSRMPRCIIDLGLFPICRMVQENESHESYTWWCGHLAWMLLGRKMDISKVTYCCSNRLYCTQSVTTELVQSSYHHQCNLHTQAVMQCVYVKPWWEAACRKVLSNAANAYYYDNCKNNFNIYNSLGLRTLKKCMHVPRSIILVSTRIVKIR